MARVKPKLCSAISGTVDGVEFAMTRQGIVAKHRKPPRGLNRPKQYEARTVLARRISDWHDMTPEAMVEWSAFAATHPVTNRLGRTIYLTGYNWFLKQRGTDDEILLPFGITPPVTNLQAIVVENTQAEFAMDFPVGCEDETIVYVFFTVYPYDLNVAWPNAEIASSLQYTKATIADLDYAHLSALGIEFHAGYEYEMRIWIQRPRYYSSNFASLRFTCRPEIQYAFHLPMDDNTDNTLVLNDWAYNYQEFAGATPNTEDHHVAGVHGGALHFDGVGDHIELTPALYESYMDTDQPFTLAIWWKPDAPMPVSIRDFLSNFALVTPSIRFSIRDDESQVFITWLWGGSKYYTSVTWPEDDVSEWRHFAVVRNGRNVRVFRNGVKNYDASNDGFQGRPWVDGNPFSIGARQASSDFAAGAADDVYLFDYALTDDEVAELAVP
jgi:hypothetical protein